MFIVIELCTLFMLGMRVNQFLYLLPSEPLSVGVFFCCHKIDRKER